MKKGLRYRIILIGVILIGVILIVGCAAFYLLFQNQPEILGLPSNCESLQNAMRSSLEQANYCTADSDCAATIEPGCPFGCYNLVNKNADFTLIRQQTQEYQNQCGGMCEYECWGSPPVLFCRNNRCTDFPPQEGDVTVTTNKTEYSVGLMIEATIANDSNTEIWQQTQCDNPFYLAKKEGTEWKMYAPEPYKKCPYIEPIFLRAGEETTQYLNLYTVYDYSPQTIGYENFSLGPARYRFEVLYTDYNLAATNPNQTEFKFKKAVSNEFALTRNLRDFFSCQSNADCQYASVEAGACANKKAFEDPDFPKWNI